ncbi:transcriptional regulator [Brevibacillus agri]|uniref:Response regulator n=1 Tax=Brevibacillus agri TaxID=51101 RepID=A0A3M8A7U6_9BACL|nr:MULTISPECIES: AAA family ATPase [Brevibacillus]EJL39970.1 ATPase involved in chromosome partitioning [Brevibacillus sp. CF112]MBG9566540.1 transcriptional regulator [Brevibacillus agri]MDR9507225.1 AAA family ATPase [Brevibacillus agri]MED1646751.1 AAA family ATPase [Brevibacillus agri]MED1657355.1 AAA family ATPase [Brevibacillus agri]
MKRRLLIVDDDREATRLLANQLAGSQLIEICGEAASVDEAWAKLQQSRPDLVLLGGVKETERGVLCQQFRLAFPHLSFIAACSANELVWEPFFRNLGIWVIAKPVQSGQVEALAMMAQSPGLDARIPAQPPQHFPKEQQGGMIDPQDQFAEPSPAFNGQTKAGIKHLITVYGPKGGVGKTFISRELAIFFSTQKKEGRPLKVLAVDFNLDLGTFATTLNLPRTPNLFTWVQDLDSQLHAFAQKRGLDPYAVRQKEWQELASVLPLSPQQIEKYVVEHTESGLGVLTSPRDIRQSFEIRDYHLYLILETLKQSSYDVILIDTAPDTTDATIQALFFAEHVVMVGTPVVDSIENIQRLLKLLREAEYPEERIQVCMNRLQRKEMFTLEEIRAYFQLHPSKRIFSIPDDGEVKKSINTGVPVMMQAGRSAAREAIETLGKALFPVDEETKKPAVKGKQSEKPSLLRWLWG